jgi:hypothetical protein
LCFATKVYQESMMQYHEDNQFADRKKSEGGSFVKVKVEGCILQVYQPKNTTKNSKFRKQQMYT